MKNLDKCKYCQRAKKEPDKNVSKVENPESSSEDYFTDIEWLSDVEDEPLIEENVSPAINVPNSHIEKTEDIIIEPTPELNIDVINPNHQIPSIRLIILYFSQFKLTKNAFPILHV